MQKNIQKLLIFLNNHMGKLVFMDILKEITGRTDVDKDIKKSAQEFIDFQANR